MSRTLEQFIRFTTDLVGLERTFRLFQALAQIFTSYPLAFSLLQHLLALTVTATAAATEKPPPPSSTAVLRGILIGLARHLALARRFLRFFRFLESFSAAHKLYLEISGDSPAQPGEHQKEKNPPSRRRRGAAIHAEQWLDVLARSFNGMYLLLEASVLADALGIEGFAPWGPVAAALVSREAQRFWLFALLCGLLSGVLRIFAVFAHTAVSEPVRPPPSTGQEDAGNGEGEGEKWDLKAEQARLREVVKRRRMAQRVWRREVLGKVRRLARGVLANALDIALPGTAVGWLDFAPGTVAVAMFATSVLTGLDVWERCGREVAALG